MVVVEIDGVVNEIPVPSEDPPLAAEYQFIVPELEVAPKDKVPVPQRELGAVEVIEGTGLTVATTAVRVDVEQPPIVAST